MQRQAEQVQPAGTLPESGSQRSLTVRKFNRQMLLTLLMAGWPVNDRDIHIPSEPAARKAFFESAKEEVASTFGITQGVVSDLIQKGKDREKGGIAVRRYLLDRCVTPAEKEMIESQCDIS